jgi:hypothetical protein
MSEKPVIVLAYSNDHDAYLDMVVRERKNVYNTLRPYHDKDYVQVEKAEHTSIDDFFEIFSRYKSRVAIFHYGGHASGSGLQLEGAGGAVETADSKGLAQLMGQQENLQLVFLNGCATRGQVEALLEAGVKAVIATAVAINDVKATEFAEQFYRGLAGQASIEKAFNIAKSFIATKYASAKQIKKSKGLKLKKKGDGAPEELPWGLYTDDESTLQWKLPTMAHNKLIVRGGGFQGKKIQLNVKFIQTLFKVLAPLNDNIQFLLEQAKKKKKMDIRRVRQEIVDSYPAPVGEQLRKLFASNDINVTRLKQLVHSYDVTAQLLCFTMLSQLWDCKMNQDINFVIEEEDLVGFNSFMSMSSESQPTFDYAEMMDSIYHTFTQNNIEPFITELGDFVKNLKEGGSLYEPNLFMMEMKKELANGISADELESFCLQAEAQLTKIMKECAFFISYKLITIKHIEIVKKRHAPAMYKLNNVMLDRVTAGVLDDVMELGTYTDDRSVILVRNTESMEDYLNITPFVLDENALTGNEKSKLYFYAYKEEEKYVYQFIDNSEEKLEISEENFDDINEQMGNFQQSIFNTEDELIDIDDDIDMDFFDDEDDDDEFEFELE